MTSITLALPSRKGKGHGILHFLSKALAVRRQRMWLSGLDDAALRDIGLSREAALREARRPLWDVPQHWLR